MTQTWRPKRRPSMADVGRRAEVSAQTVSRFYTGGYVSAASRAKIEKAVRELGYTHSRLPQILRSQRTDTIGFLSLGPLNFGNAGILTGISRGARDAGQSILATQLDIDPDAENADAQIDRALQNFVSMRVDGIIVGTPYRGLDPLIDTIRQTVPVVSLSEIGDGGTDSLHTDSYGAARLAVSHLVNLGHRDIVHLAGPANRNEATGRQLGYIDELVAHGITPLPIVPCREWDAASGAAAAREVPRGTFTAVFSGNDEIALGFMSEMRTFGLVAPDDYSIVGVDDMPEAQYFVPPLTSARLDFEALGESAVETLLARIQGEPERPTRTFLSALSIRSSTASLGSRPGSAARP